MLQTGNKLCSLECTRYSQKITGKVGAVDYETTGVHSSPGECVLASSEYSGR